MVKKKSTEKYLLYIWQKIHTQYKKTPTHKWEKGRSNPIQKWAKDLNGHFQRQYPNSQLIYEVVLHFILVIRIKIKTIMWYLWTFIRTANLKNKEKWQVLVRMWNDLNSNIYHRREDKMVQSLWIMVWKYLQSLM